ncbi:response regulator, partial [candidate division KSB3 bacterium]|nr:response regulator [candidate division KSB3 bacterium]MBD3326868.1 response regulator [candidate division KSB3 bacterium]
MKSDNISLAKASILVVDDNHSNLRLLTGILTERGYMVRPVPDGHLAIASAKAALPDLIILDIMMPDISGYEVCAQLKADARTRDVPVIFISALHEILDKVKAFELGGVDYLTKPFQAEEVVARVETHLTLHRLKEKLQEQNVELRALNASKDKFFSIIAHDLRGPMNGLHQLTEFAAENLEEYGVEKLREIFLLQRKSVKNLLELVENLLMWARMQRGVLEYKPQPLVLKHLVERNIELCAPLATQKQIALQVLETSNVIIS